MPELIFSKNKLHLALKVQINHLKAIKTKIWEKWSQTKIWLDLLENLHTSQFEGAEYESVFKDFIFEI